MLKSFLSCWCILFAFSVLGQNIPKVKFNHLFLVLSTSDLNAIRNSGFIKNQLTALETRTTKADNGESWTGTYMYGSENYVELLDSVGFQPNGNSGIGFSVDSVGELFTLKAILDKNYKTALFKRERNFEEVKIPWFDGLSIDDSVFDSKSKFGWWMMSYRKEYFDYRKLAYANGLLTRENYLKEKEPDRNGKMLKRFSGVVLKLNSIEKEFFKKYLTNLSYVYLNRNEYVSPDNFKFIIRDRPLGDNNTIGSLLFETTKKMNTQTIKISENISVRLKGNEGQITFR
ncbi:MAG TPA: DUF5829 family protein [Puia sp.]|nr:DUF5829 family protein [Puia sp.]